jgi:uncharacterized protein with GYD domain
MAKFLWHGSYSERGAKALVEQGGTQRCAEVERAVTAMGGTLEAMYFAFGDDDFYAIVDPRTMCREPRSAWRQRRQARCNSRRSCC